MSNKIIGVTVGTPIRPSKFATELADRVEEMVKANTEQEKTVDITENGTVEIVPDVGYKLTKVTANVNVSGENPLVSTMNDTIEELTVDNLRGATKIKRYAFYNNNLLSKATLPEGITLIENDAFNLCSKLREVVIPDSATKIGERAFRYNNALDTVYLGSGISEIGSEAFYIYGGIPITVYYAGDLLSWYNITWKAENSIPCNKPSKTDYNFYLKNSLGEYEPFKTLVIPNDFTEIKKYGFYKINTDNTIIPNTVTTIGERALACNNKIKNIVIPNNVTTLGKQALAFCESLEEVRIGNGVTSLDDWFFTGCGNITDIYIDAPEGSISGSPWYAMNATIHWNSPLPSEEV